jgi:hypothetical protein
MYLFSVDESGNRDPRTEIPRADGSTVPGDLVYVLTAVALLDHKWHGFELTINRLKRTIKDRICREHDLRLDLADCEIKSNWVRQPRERARRPFLAHMTDDELNQLIGMFLSQLAHHKMRLFTVVVDKARLHAYMDQTKLHRKAWELLVELIEDYMRVRHDRHQTILIADDMSREQNRSLAMKHIYIAEEGTRSDKWLSHICEMPLFVRSELSNGAQLADLRGYNVYRAFKDRNLGYIGFDKIRPYIWSRQEPRVPRPFSGIRVFSDDSPLWQLVNDFENERASIRNDRGPS